MDKLEIQKYFDETEGTGILATSDSQGVVDGAIYARPQVLEDGTVAFIMADKLSHENLQSNPRAAYIFHSDERGYKGLRLYLTKLDETDDEETIRNVPKRCSRDHSRRTDAKRHLVRFSVDKVRALVGDQEY